MALDPITGQAGARQLVGQSPAMQEIFKRIVLLADNEMSVLVQGESGTGKELVARAIHSSGKRAGGPFVAINCAAIPEQLIESELFGHERGAFTDARQMRPGRFELAGQGTLFLDEISELPLGLQSKLLRVLQERTFERVGGSATIAFQARLVCATNRDLAAAVAAGEFREDLFHRINLVTINVPPLRERRDDIAELVRSLLGDANREAGKSITAVEQAVLDQLRVARLAGQRPRTGARHQALRADGQGHDAHRARPRAGGRFEPARGDLLAGAAHGAARVRRRGAGCARCRSGGATCDPRGRDDASRAGVDRRSAQGHRRQPGGGRAAARDQPQYVALEDSWGGRARRVAWAGPAGLPTPVPFAATGLAESAHRKFVRQFRLLQARCVLDHRDR